MDITLVNMPFAAIQRPSIALGTLKSVLQANGLKVHVTYANLWYAEFIGLDPYLRIEDTRAQDVLGDWIFGAAIVCSVRTAIWLVALQSKRLSYCIASGDSPRHLLTWSLIAFSRSAQGS
jgi:hypothetical protein